MSDERVDERTEVDFDALSDEELVASVYDELSDGLGEHIQSSMAVLLERGWESEKLLADALVEGMRGVGIDYREGHLPDASVLRAIDAFASGLGVLRPSAVFAPNVGAVFMGAHPSADGVALSLTVTTLVLRWAGVEVHVVSDTVSDGGLRSLLGRRGRKVFGVCGDREPAVDVAQSNLALLERHRIREETLVFATGAAFSAAQALDAGLDRYCPHAVAVLAMLKDGI